MVQEGSLVTLRGSYSFDPDGDVLTYAWVQTGGPAVALTGADSVTPTFTAPWLSGGVYGGAELTFQLTVSDGALSGSDTVAVTVEQINHAPVAHAGANQTVHEAGSVTLNGSTSHDPDGDPIVSYAWTQINGPSVTLSDPASATPTFTAPVTGSGGTTLGFSLTVSDGQLSSEPAMVTVTVVDINDPPRCDQARASRPHLWPPDHKLIPVSIVGVTDPNNDQVTITVTGVTQDEQVQGLGDGDTSPDAVLQGATVLLRAERAGGGNGRVYQVAFIANDNQVTGGSCTGTITVEAPPSMKKGIVVVDDCQFYNATQP